MGLGAVLSQKTGLGTKEVLAYGSSSLNRAECNYSATEKECLAVVCLGLGGRFFTVVTDPLLWVFKTQRPSAHLTWWALQLQEFTFAVEYRKGRYNTVPNALSRAPHNSATTTSHLPPACTTLLSVKGEAGKDLLISDDQMWRVQ